MWLTSRIEADIHELEIEGRIPPELDGMFCTVGPEPLFAPRADLSHHIPIHGDGLMSSVSISNGRASYKSRYVHTDKYKLEKAAGKALFGAYRNPFTDDPACADVDPGTGNTTMFRHAGKLMVLKEDALPIEIDPTTLATIGTLDFDGFELPGPNMSAHPKLCPNTGELINVGTMVNGPGSNDYVIYTISADGKIKTAEVLTGPYACMMHDFVITEKHIVIPFFPSICDVERMQQGGPVWEWNDSLPASIAVIPRDGSVADVQWIPLDEAYYCIHYFNGYADGNTIVVDVIKFAQNYLFMAPNAMPDFSSSVVRWEIDLVAGKVKESTVLDGPLEFPRIDERFNALKHRYGWLPLQRHGDQPFQFDTLACIDFDTGETQSVEFGEGAMVMEFVFVPRAETANEGDGFLVGYVGRLAEGTTDFVIFDALALGNGPIGTVKIPYLVPRKIHGGWFASS